MKTLELTDVQFKLLKGTLDDLITLGYRKAVGDAIINVLGQVGRTDAEIKTLKSIHARMKRQ